MTQDTQGKITAAHKANFKIYKGRIELVYGTWSQSLESPFFPEEVFFFFVDFSEVNGRNGYWVLDATGTRKMSVFGQS